MSECVILLILSTSLKINQRDVFKLHDQFSDIIKRTQIKTIFRRLLLTSIASLEAKKSQIPDLKVKWLAERSIIFLH